MVLRDNIGQVFVTLCCFFGISICLLRAPFYSINLLLTERLVWFTFEYYFFMHTQSNGIQKVHLSSSLSIETIEFLEPRNEIKKYQVFGVRKKYQSSRLIKAPSQISRMDYISVLKLHERYKLRIIIPLPMSYTEWRLSIHLCKYYVT